MNLNRATLVGRVTQDPETRSTSSGQSVTTLNLATNRVWNDRNTGQKNEQVEYHSVVCWGGLSDIVQRYVNKGQLLMIEGRLQTRSWDGKDGVKRYKTEIIAENLQLGPRSGEGTRSPNPAPVASTARATTPTQETEDDDIPVINEDSPTSGVTEEKPAENDVEETEVDLKDIPF